MKTLLFTIQSYIDRFIFGSRCAGCETPGASICQKCLEKIPLSCATDHKSIYGLYDYGNPLVSHSIWSLKYHHRGALAKTLAKKGSGVLSEIIGDELQSEGAQSIVCVPIPQHRAKTRVRGFNQSHLIARWFAQELPNTSVVTLLEKTRETLPQSHLSDRNQRMKNTHDTMRASRALSATTLYLVVDDVTTTGATFLEAMRALRFAGARNILCIALAHGYKRR